MPFNTTPVGASNLAHQAMNVLYQHRLVSSSQLGRLLTPAATQHEYLRRQLRQLRKMGLASCVGRRVLGTAENLWWLTDTGRESVEAAGLLPQRPYRMSLEAAMGPLQEHTLATVESGLAFVEWARRLGHECGPLDWTPEIAHYYRDEHRPGEDCALVPDAIVNYVHADARQRTLLTYFVEVDRAQMTVARLAAKLHSYARYRDFVPQQPGRGVRRTNTTPAWRYRYAVFPRVLFVLTDASKATLQRRIEDLRILAAADPALENTRVRAGATTLDDLRDRGPFDPIFTPLMGATPEPTDAWLKTPTSASA